MFTLIVGTLYVGELRAINVTRVVCAHLEATAQRRNGLTYECLSADRWVEAYSLTPFYLAAGAFIIVALVVAISELRSRRSRR